MKHKPQPTIVFLTDIPAPASGDQELIVISDEDKKAYREAIVKPSASLLAYPSDFSDPEIQAGSIAYHPIFGTISYRSWWRFSTAQFMADLKAAEENPNIYGHLIHVDSGGGDAFGLHEAFEIVRDLKKPCVAVIESCGGSAGYYLAAAADKVYASAEFSMVGCIGIASVIVDDSEYWEKSGVKFRTMVSNYSPLKNKTFHDAEEGKTKEYIERYLDPMALQFINDVKSVRPSVSEAAQQGDTFYTQEAIAAGLIDGKKSVDDVLDEMLSEAAAAIEKQHIEQITPSVDINTLNFTE